MSSIHLNCKLPDDLVFDVHQNTEEDIIFGVAEPKAGAIVGIFAMGYHDFVDKFLSTRIPASEIKIHTEDTISKALPVIKPITNQNGNEASAPKSQSDDKGQHANSGNSLGCKIAMLIAALMTVLLA